MDVAVDVLLGIFPISSQLTDAQYDKRAREHVRKVTTLCQAEASLIKEQCVDVLKLLDPTINSISYLAILDTVIAQRKGNANFDKDSLLECLIAFLLTFDSRQTRYMGSSFCRLLSHLLTGRILSHEQTVQVGVKALLRLDPSSSTLTQHHIALANLAVQSGQIDHIFELIDKDIIFYPRIDQRLPPGEFLCDLEASSSTYMSVEAGITTALRPTQILQHDLVCGLLYCERRRWQQAMTAFARVATYPTKELGVSKVMVEAYKKWILVNLLSTGNPGASLSSSEIASSTKRILDSLTEPYAALSSAFAAVDPSALREAAEANMAVWQEERNTGLVQAVVAAHQEWQIITLRDVYSTISISDIRARLKGSASGVPPQSDEEFEQVLRNMIEQGRLRATIEHPIDGSSPYLRLLSTTEELSETQFNARIAEASSHIQRLAPVSKVHREHLSTSKEYLRHLANEQKRAEEDLSGNGRGASMTTPGWDGDTNMHETGSQSDASIEDEDLLA